ncbi:MAG: hypothetical protein KatS3mg087_0065 [Patescibacteria group bacterium]|nr:MAG: hypothetical protein KatS3mg087_0065 [Patescibacteria group bacterium]
MRVSDAVFYVSQAGVPVCLKGDYGLGKTTIINLFASWLGYRCVRFRLLGAVPEDFIGYPKVVEKNGRLVTAQIPSEEIITIFENPLCTVIFDELNRADEALQNVIATIVDRGLGQFNLPDSALIFATMNEYGLGTYELNEALISRFAFFDCELDLKEEIDALITGVYKTEAKFRRLPENWQEFIPSARLKLSAFIEHRPTVLAKERLNVQNSPWPCPRTLHKNAVRGLAAILSLHREDLEEDVLKACVGAPFALEYTAFRKNLSLPDPREVLQQIRSGHNVDYPNPYTLLISMSDVLVIIASLSDKEDKLSAVNSVLEFLSKCKFEEVVVPLVKSILQQYPSARVPVRLMKIKEFLKGLKDD